MIKERWTRLNKNHTTDLNCQAVTEDGVADCEQDVEWEFLYHVRSFFKDERDYVPIFYCNEHKKDRSADPKWWSLRRQLPGIMLQHRDFLAKAFRTVQPKCPTCTSLSELMKSEQTNEVFLPAQRIHLTILQANRQLEHWGRQHRQGTG